MHDDAAPEVLFRADAIQRPLPVREIQLESLVPQLVLHGFVDVERASALSEFEPERHICGLAGVHADVELHLRLVLMRMLHRHAHADRGRLHRFRAHRKLGLGRDHNIGKAIRHLHEQPEDVCAVGVHAEVSAVVPRQRQRQLGFALAQNAAGNYPCCSDCDDGERKVL
eukprot:714891-Rhodomonas_salina.3